MLSFSFFSSFSRPTLVPTGLNEVGANWHGRGGVSMDGLELWQLFVGSRRALE